VETCEATSFDNLHVGIAEIIATVTACSDHPKERDGGHEGCDPAPLRIGAARYGAIANASGIELRNHLSFELDTRKNH
jgi:hypothetical protein